MNTSNGWAPQAPLGEVLTKNCLTTEIAPDTTYREVTVKLWGRGVVERRTALGSEIAAASRSVVRAGQFILSRIDARNGATGIVPDELDGAVVSNDFPTFNAVPQKLLPEYLGWLSKTHAFVDTCRKASEGTTNRVRIKEDAFLRQTIPLPPLAEQRRIVAKIECLAGKIKECIDLSTRSRDSQSALLNSHSASLFRAQAEKLGTTELGKLIVYADYGTSVKCSSERDACSTPILRIPNVAAEAITLDDLKFAHLSDLERKKVTVDAGDILIVRTNGSADLVGRCAVVEELSEPHGFASYLIRLRLNRDAVSPNYAQSALRYLRNSGQLFDLARTTAGQYNVSLGRLRGAAIPVPPVDVQREIVNELAHMEARVAMAATLSSQTSVELNAMLPSILDRAFRGEL